MTNPFITKKIGTNQVIEACVGNLEEAIYTQAQGADRLELCSALELDGLTPSYALIKSVLSQVSIPIKVMIRPRAGDFEYSKEEKLQIKQEVEMCKALGVRDLVYGSTREGRLDIEDIIAFYEAYIPVRLTVHKAIDTSSQLLDDVFDLLKWVKSSKANVSILSSGGQPTALEGAVMLNRMQRICGDEIELVVAGKVTVSNLEDVKKAIPVRAYHGRKIV